MSSVTVAWTVLALTGGVALGIDLWVGARRSGSALRPAVVATIAWTLTGLAFTGVVALLLGTTTGGEYLTVFVLEKSLSLDNVAVFAVLLSAIAVPPAQRRQVLAGGIVLALVFRIGLVAAGLAVVSAVDGLLVVFGVVLLVAGVRMARRREETTEQPPRLVAALARRRISPAMAALVGLGLADVVFAVDSVPAAFAVTRDAYPVMAANVFAVLGLRPMYDLLAVALSRLRHLERALGVLLVLLGVALCVEPLWAVPELVLLGAVVVTLGTGIGLSLRPERPGKAWRSGGAGRRAA